MKIVALRQKPSLFATEKPAGVHPEAYPVSDLEAMVGHCDYIIAPVPFTQACLQEKALGFMGYSDMGQARRRLATATCLACLA
jgi:hypothetical protein